MSILSDTINAFQHLARAVTANGKAESGGGGSSNGNFYYRSKKGKTENIPEYVELFNRKNSFGQDKLMVSFIPRKGVA